MLLFTLNRKIDSLETFLTNNQGEIIFKHVGLITKDIVENNIIPYGLYTGIRSNLRGLNLIGLKRKDFHLRAVEVCAVVVVCARCGRAWSGTS